MSRCASIVIALFCVGPLFSQGVKFGKVSKKELEEKVYKPDATAHAAYLYKYRNSYYQYYKGSGVVLITEIHERIKIYDKEGFPYGTQEINLYKSSDDEIISGVKGFTFNLEDGEIVKHKLGKDGIFKTELNKHIDQVKISMPNVKEGSVLEYEYKVTSPFIQDIDFFVFQESIPIKSLDAKLQILEYFKYNQNHKGSLPLTPKVERTMNPLLKIKQDVITFTLQNIPALKKEKFVANMDNYRSGVKFEVVSFEVPGSKYVSFSKTWEDVAETIFKSSSFGNEIDRTGYFEDDLAAILMGSSDEKDKARKILAFVKDKVKWNSYFGYTADEGVKKSYEEGTGNVGDINLMLISMLRHAGIKTYPVLLSTRDHGIPLFPTLRGFNYVIAAAMLNGEECLIDASDQYAMIDVLPVRTLNWFGRKISGSGASEMVALSPKMKSKESSRISVTILDDGSISGKMRQQFTKHNALAFRNNFFKVDEAAHILQLEKDLQGVEVSNYVVNNGKALAKPVTHNFDYYKEDMIEEISGNIYFNPLFHLGETENPFKSEKREFPVDFGHAWEEDVIVAIAIPEGYTVSSVPESFAMSLPGEIGSFKYLVSHNGKHINVRATVSFEVPVIPTDQYAALKEFYRQLVEKETEKVVLSKISADEYTERTAGGR